MPRLIDADVLIQDFKNHKIPFNADINEAIICAPTVDAEPVRHGHWKQSCSNGREICSVCGLEVLYGMSYDLAGNIYPKDYCPHCGAKMDSPCSNCQEFDCYGCGAKMDKEGS